VKGANRSRNILVVPLAALILTGPAAKGRKLPFSDRHFAEVDGDRELELVTYYPQVPSGRGGVSSESYKLQVFRLLDDTPPRWIFEAGRGLHSHPASGDYHADWGYEWTFKPVAHDIDGDRRWPMDEEGDHGRNVCLNFARLYGVGGKLLPAVDLSDAPTGDVIPWKEHKLNHLWFNVDIVGDSREDIPVQMPDGSVRVYINTQEPPRREPCL